MDRKPEKDKNPESLHGTVRLSARLSALAAMVSTGNRLADIGCDHGYLPIALCREERIPGAIAIDVKEGPLDRAREHIAAYGLSDRIETRLSDGLGQLGEGEADTVLIAGMGGLLIRRILSERPLPDSVTELVLAPQSETAQVRRCVRELGFSIADEEMVEEDGKFYPILKAEREARDIPVSAKEERTDPGQERQEMEDLFGPVLLRERHPVLLRWLERERDTTDAILAHLAEESGRTAGADPGEQNGRPAPSGSLQVRQRELEHYRKLLADALALY